MNKYFIKYIFLFFIINSSFFPEVSGSSLHSNIYNCFAQTPNEPGSPFIRNYPPKEYNAYIQNWAIVQDNRGVMYFGNSDGVLEYDGSNWRLIKIISNSTVRSLAIDSTGTIYVGAVGEFGYLIPDSIGKLHYKSLINFIDTADRKFADVWQIRVAQEKIYFLTYTALFRYNPELQNKTDIDENINTSLSNDSLFKIWKPQNSFESLFFVNKKLFIKESEVGLMQIINDSLHILEGSEQFANTSIYTMLPFGSNQILIGTNSKGLFVYDPQRQKSNRFTKPECFKEIDIFLTENQLYEGCILPGNLYALCTIRKGLAIVDANGNIIKLINKQNGIPDNTILYAYNHKQELWLALMNGISHVEWGSSIRFWDETSGLKGLILDIVRYKGILFVATLQGVYYLDNNRFKEVSKIKTRCWNFLSYSPSGSSDSSILLIGTTNGIYEIKASFLTEGFSAHLIKNDHIVFKLYNSPNNKHKIYAGLKDGILVMEYKNGKWNDKGKISGITEEVRYIAEDTYNNIWLGTTYNGIIRLSKDNDTIVSKYLISRYDTSSGLPVAKYIRIYNYNDDLLFTTDNGIYKYDKTLNIFIPDTSLEKKFTDGSTGIYRFVEDHNGNCWVGANSYKPFTEVLIKQDNSLYKRDTIPFKRIPYMEVQAIYPESNGITWIGGIEGLFSYDSNIKSDHNQAYFTLIRKVTVGNDSVIFWGSGYGSSENKTKANIEGSENHNDLTLSYKDNSLIFNYSTPYFSPEEANLYSYFLQGYKRNKPGWSSWTKETKKEYTNLPEGSYTFHVKAKNIYGIESITATYNFRILPPWYRTFLAYVLYIIAGILIIRFSGILYSRRLKAANIRLEKIVAIRTREIRKQKQEITDSIIYAKRIQTAVLPPNDIIARNLSQYFILFKPRDIVSGDFYWMIKVDNLLIITVADCTGHGVPGAFMSMLGIALLNDIVRYKEITTAGQALNELRNQVKAALRQSGKEGEAEDGMDMSLCVIDFENMKMQFAGARNPLYIIRNNELIIIKADKMPIGIYYKDDQSFTNHEIDIQKGDAFYMFSDGFIDQFGGAENIRFSNRQFKKILTEIHEKPMPEQKQILNETLTNWMDKEKQIDDITVLGFKI